MGWGAASVPGPLRAFFLRIKDRKGANVAAVATARKIATLIWQSYARIWVTAA